MSDLGGLAEGSGEESDADAGFGGELDDVVGVEVERFGRTELVVGGELDEHLESVAVRAGLGRDLFVDRW
jgi:hypothetical protein